MIRYTLTYTELTTLVDAKAPKWRSSAAARTKKLKALGKFVEGSPDWGEVKPVLMRLQGENKCIYCERKFGSEELSLVEHDLEHFRPKGNVDPWEIPVSVTNAGIKVTPPPKNKGGYYLLAFHLDNYSASCKTCNSRLKSDRFPIAGTYQLKGTDPRKINAKEKPLLLYPFGDMDIDPESVIAFKGYTPVPIGKGHNKDRAHVTIAFFALDSEDVRGDLFFERSLLITRLWEVLEKSNDIRLTKAERDKAAKEVERLRSPRMMHASCIRSFVSLYTSDKAEAKRYYEESEAYFNSKTGG